jgi:hypothetical protein
MHIYLKLCIKCPPRNNHPPNWVTNWSWNCDSWLQLVWGVHAAITIAEIKSSMNLTDWTGDPCVPVPHPWVTCSTDINSVLSITAVWVIFLVYWIIFPWQCRIPLLMGMFDKNNIIFRHAEIIKTYFFSKIKKSQRKIKYLLKYLVIFYLSKC